MSAPGSDRAGCVLVDSRVTEPFVHIKLSVHLTERRVRRMTECGEHTVTLFDIEGPTMKRGHRVSVGERNEVVVDRGILGGADRLEAGRR